MRIGHVPWGEDNSHWLFCLSFSIAFLKTYSLATLTQGVASCTIWKSFPTWWAKTLIVSQFFLVKLGFYRRKNIPLPAIVEKESNLETTRINMMPDYIIQDLRGFLYFDVRQRITPNSQCSKARRRRRRESKRIRVSCFGTCYLLILLGLHTSQRWN